MKKKLFKELVASIREAGATLRAEKNNTKRRRSYPRKPSDRTARTHDDKK